MAVKILGDLAAGDLVRFSFNTVGENKAPITLAGVSTQSHFAIAKDGSDMLLAADTVTVSVDAGSVTGYHVVTVDTTKAGFDAGSDYEIRLTAGTIDSISHVGAVLATWSLENRTTALRDGTITANTFDTGVISTDEQLATTFWAALLSGNTAPNSFGELLNNLVDNVVKKFGVALTVTGTPTTTSIDVTSAESLTNTQIDNALLLHLDTGRYTRITNITGTTITVSPALPSAPVAGHEIVVFGQYLASL